MALFFSERYRCYSYKKAITKFEKKTGQSAGKFLFLLDWTDARPQDGPLKEMYDELVFINQFRIFNLGNIIEKFKHRALRY